MNRPPRAIHKSGRTTQAPADPSTGPPHLEWRFQRLWCTLDVPISDGLGSERFARYLLTKFLDRPIICNELGRSDVSLVMHRIWLVLMVAVMASACGPSVGADVPRGAEVCEADPGSATDLRAEPKDWLNYGLYLRWADNAGCMVRIDVISHHRGAEHCGWEAMQFITIGEPLGNSIARDGLEERGRYLWDPNGVLPDGPFGKEINRADLPDSAYDTGYRRSGAELWLDESDSSVIFVISRDAGQLWERSSSGLCA